MLPRLLGAGLQGMSSVGGAIQKSVRTGSQAIGALALSQTEPEVLAAMAGGKKLLSKINLTRRSPRAESSSLEPEVMDSAISMPTDSPLAGLQQAIEGVGESITNRLSSLETRLSDMADDVFSLNFTTDVISTVLEEISTIATSILGAMPDLENRRESSRRRRARRRESSLTRADGTTASGGGGGMMAMLGLLPLLGILGSVAAAIAPIAVPLIGAVAGITALIAFLKSDFADKITDAIANSIFDPEEELAKLNENSKQFVGILTDMKDRQQEHYDSLSAEDRAAVDEFKSDVVPVVAANNRTGTMTSSARVDAASKTGNVAVLEQEIIRAEGTANAVQQNIDTTSYDDSWWGTIKGLALLGLDTTTLGGASMISSAMGGGTSVGILGEQVKSGIGVQSKIGESELAGSMDRDSVESRREDAARARESIQQITTNNNTTIVNPTEPKSPTTDGPIGTPTGRFSPV